MCYEHSANFQLKKREKPTILGCVARKFLRAKDFTYQYLSLGFCHKGHYIFVWENSEPRILPRPRARNFLAVHPCYGTSLYKSFSFNFQLQFNGLLSLEAQSLTRNMWEHVNSC